MINGAHFLFYSTDPEADRAFFRDVLEFRSVDVGHGWLIFKLPPAEVAVHPSNGELRQPPADHMLGAVLYLMCDDIRSAVKSLEAKKVTCSPLTEEPWGTVTTFTVPSGGGVGLYQPSHPTALDLGMS